MVVVAGPPGSGKSSHFPVEGGPIDGFNVDLRAAAYNGGSFRDIPRAVRDRARRECEAFIDEHLAEGKSFAVETTLRSGVAIEQARRAQGAGFETDMIFVTAGRPEECVARVRLRGLAGGHAASEGELRDIYARSMANLVQAAEVFDRIDLYDASVRGAPPRLVGRVAAGRFVPAVAPLPDWLPERFR
jgi:predicted ABC-type ATPase